MTSVDKGLNPNGFEGPKPRTPAYRIVPKPGFFNKLLHRTMKEILPQYDPGSHRQQNFDFQYLVYTGALKPNILPVPPPTAQPEAEKGEMGVIADPAAAIALRAVADQAHRTNRLAPLENLS